VSGVVRVPAVFTYIYEHTGRERPMRVDLVWDPEYPFTVEFRFRNHTQSVWSIGRDLVVDALTSAAAGEGDARFWQSGEDLGLVLHTPSGRAEFVVPRAALVEVVVVSEPLFRAAVDAWRDAWLAGVLA